MMRREEDELEPKGERTTGRDEKQGLDTARVGQCYLLATAVAMGVALVLRVLGGVTGERGALLHRVADLLIVYGIATPSVTPALAGLLLPQLIGARGAAFTRLYQASFFVFMLGGFLLLGAFLPQAEAAVPASWLLTTVYRTEAASPAETALLLGIGLIAAATVMSSISLLGTVHFLRRRGMSWERLPFGALGLYAHALVTLLSAPLLITAVLLAGADRALSLRLFQAGEDPFLFQQLFWRGLHPLLFTAPLPVLGLALQALLGPATGSWPRRAFILTAGLACLGHGQHLMSRSAPVVTVLSSFYSVLALALLLALVLLPLRRLPVWPRADLRPVLPALLALALVIVFLTLGVASAALSTNLGRDAVLFGRPGRDLLMVLVAMGFVAIASAPRCKA